MTLEDTGSTLMFLLFAGTMFCEFLRFGKKITKLSTSTRKNFYQHIRHSGVYTIKNCMMFPLWNMHNHSPLIVSAISFLPSRATMSSRKWRLMISIIVGVSRAKLKLCSRRITTAHWPCGMFHVTSRRLHVFTLQQLQSRHSLSATFAKPVDFKVKLSTFRCEISQKFSSTS